MYSVSYMIFQSRWRNIVWKYGLWIKVFLIIHYKKDPDITKPTSEREVGGLGIFMIKEFILIFLLMKEKWGELSF